MKIGDIYSEKITITDDLIKKFAEYSGDYNPIHFNDSEAQKAGFPKKIAHGMASASLFSKILATTFPGPGAVYLGQTFKFHSPIFIGENLIFKLEVVNQKDSKPIFTIKTEVYGTNEDVRISGEAIVLYKQSK